MSLHECIEPKITGTADHQIDCKSLLQLITDAFARGGQEAVTAELAAQMAAIEQQFDVELEELERTL
jgi:hypothetical protein